MLAVDETRLALMPSASGGQVTFHAADELVAKVGYRLERVTARFMESKGGLALSLLHAEEGLFVVLLCITLNQADREPDMHCVAYDGHTVRDNYQGTKVKVLDASDCESKEKARAVFDSLFPPGLVVRLVNVYELVQR
jgi:hypothetical protein